MDRAADDTRAFWQSSYEYALDFSQRTVLFWDTLRQRGNNFVEHERAASRRCCISSTSRCSMGARSRGR
jgi:hypothetical protein